MHSPRGRRSCVHRSVQRGVGEVDQQHAGGDQYDLLDSLLALGTPMTVVRLESTL